MTMKPVPYDGGRPAISAGIARRAGGRLLHEVREALPPTLFFLIGFNLIVLTTNLLVAQYLVAVGNFMLATLGALLVGKSVLVANKIPLLKLYDRAPLIQPILFKTAFYWVVVAFVRLLERLVHFVADDNRPVDFSSYLATTFSWRHFAAVSLWLFVLFLVYVTASEFSQLFGRGEVRRLLFTRRPSNLQLNRRQRGRELMRLGRLADAYTADDLRDPTSAAHRELAEILGRLARQG
jgi:hypothetical protein